MLESISTYLYIGTVVIILVILTFMLLVLLPGPKCYFDVEEFSELKKIESDEYLKIFKEELIPLSDQVSNIYVDGLLLKLPDEYPKSYELFRSIPFIEQILLYKLNAKTDMPKQKGSADLANHTLRAVMPLKISGTQKSGIWVDGTIKFYTEGKWIIYDNSREHSMFNKHKRFETYLLIIDIKRPKHIPVGIATENHDIII